MTDMSPITALRQDCPAAALQDEPTPALRATVVIPLHDHADWIGAQIASLFAQWRPGLELLVIDDASTDGSYPAALAALAARPDIPATLLRNERPLHHGLAAQVLDLTTTPVIIKADSDDIALPGRLDTVLEAFAIDPACRLVTSNALLLTTDGTPIGIYDPDALDRTLIDPTLHAERHGSPTWLGATMAFHRSLLAAFPPIDPDLCPYGLDIVLAFRATLLGAHRCIGRPLVGWRQHGRNAHRVAGVLHDRPEMRAQYEALELMALAQRIRDCRHAASLPDPAPARGAAALAPVQDTFFRRYDVWCRLHNAAQAASAAAGPRVPPVPPIPTLAPGLHPFGVSGPLGPLAARWGGFYPPEEDWNWTSAAALLVFRTPPGVGRLVLHVAAQAWQDRQRLRVSVNLQTPVETMMDGAATLAIEVPLTGRWGLDVVVLLIEAPDARRIADADPATPDRRQFGAMLRWLELAPRHPARQADGANPGLHRPAARSS